MNNESDPVDVRRTYQPPQLVAISLRPEEAVLGHCKISTVGGSASLTSCTLLGACLSIGS
jgi:hypothetical protein